MYFNIKICRCVVLRYVIYLSSTKVPSSHPIVIKSVIINLSQASNYP